MEPLTLSVGQLRKAREAAGNIMQTKQPAEALTIFTKEAAVDIIQKQPDEALTIFTKGLRPVRSMREMESLLQEEAQQLHDMQDKSHAIRLYSSSGSRPVDIVKGASSAPF